MTTFNAHRYVMTATTAATPYAFATIDGSDRGASSCRKRAAEHAARICRETKQVVLFIAPGERWQLTPVAGRAHWTAAGEAA